MKRSPSPQTWFLLGCLFTALAAPASATLPSALAGHWQLDPSRSSAVDPFRTIRLEVSVSGDRVSITKTMDGGKRSTADTLNLDLGRAEVTEPMVMWVDNRHIGAWIGDDRDRRVRAELLDAGATLRVESNFKLETSQGTTPVRVTTEYRLSPDGKRLTVLELRSTRNRPLHYTFDRKEAAK